MPDLSTTEIRFTVDRETVARLEAALERLAESFKEMARNWEAAGDSAQVWRGNLLSASIAPTASTAEAMLFRRSWLGGSPDELAEAQNKASELFLSLLTDEQRRDYQERDCFLVKSEQGRFYKLVREPSENVYLLEDADVDARITARYCLEFQDDTIPLEDQLAAQTLMLQHDENRFLNLANKDISGVWDAAPH